MRSRPVATLLLGATMVVGACSGAASPSPSGAASDAPPGSAAAEPSASAAGEPSASAGEASASAPTATGRCSAESADLTKTSTGPNREESTPTTELPDLTDAQVEEVKAAAYKWAYLPSGTSTWFGAVEAGARAETARLGMELVVTADSNFDPAKQAADVETAMASDPDIILTLPVDPTSAAEAFRPAVEAGVKLVFNDNGIDGYEAGTDYVAIVTGDHFGMGEAAAELMAEAVGEDGGEIGFIFHDADFYVTNNRDCRFKAVIEQNHPNIRIVAEQGMTEEGQTEQITSAMLTQNPNIEAIYVTWSSAGAGTIAALRAAGKPDVKVVTHDLDAANDLDMALGGNMFGAAADKPFEIGQIQIRAAALSLLGEDVPGFLTVPVVKETRDNIAEAWLESLNAEVPPEILEALGQ